ncbi:IS5/IS1182 family transposase, partial [Methylobacterium sp. E-041]|nr:IS5/IS1182 family transposase [Methylobacterium sp. E-041]
MRRDAQRSELEPWVEACRPKAKTPQRDLRRARSAMLWRHQNGAKRPGIPADRGPWGLAGRVSR